MSKYQCNLEAGGDFEKFDIRISSNGSKLFYYDGKRIAKSRVPLCIKDTLTKKISKKTVSDRPPPITSYLNLLPPELKRELSLYFADDTFQSLLKYHNWKWLLTDKFFLIQKVYSKLLIPCDILRIEDLECLQYLAKQPLNRNKLLYNAAIHGNLSQLKLLVATIEKDKCATGLNGKLDLEGLFANAAAHGQLSIVKWLICQGYVNVNNGVKLALAYNHYNVAEFILTEYKDQIEIDKLSERIIATNSLSLLSKLVETFQVNLNGLLYVACGISTVEVVTYLINHGAIAFNSALCNAHNHKNGAVIDYLTKLIEKTEQKL